MALRREARLRKEYLYRKSLEGVQRAQYEKKRKLREAMAQGVIPTELREEEEKLSREIQLDTFAHEHQEELPTIDDEYAEMGHRDPKICVTTSRDPSARLKQFLKEIKVCIPNSQSVNRGNTRVNELVDACKKNDFTDLIVLHETRGEPDGMVVSHLPFGPTAYFTLSNCVLRHDIPDVGPVSQVYPHLIFENFQSTMGRRVSTILKALFPVAKADSQRVVTFANEDDFISFRHHMFSTSGKEVQLSEVGPRLEMQLYMIKLGTVEQTDAENEWVLRPYMNTARKRQVL